MFGDHSERRRRRKLNGPCFLSLLPVPDNWSGISMYAYYSKAPLWIKVVVGGGVAWLVKFLWRHLKWMDGCQFIKKYFSGQKGTALFLNPGKRGRKNVYDINIKILKIFSAVLFKNQDIWECRPHAVLLLYPLGFVLKTASAIETFDSLNFFFFCWFNKGLYACGLCRLRSKIINSVHRFFFWSHDGQWSGN